MDCLQVSGKLFPFSKDERKAQAVKILKGIRVPRRDLYLPTNPESRVVSLVPESGQPMLIAPKETKICTAWCAPTHAVQQ